MNLTLINIALYFTIAFGFWCYFKGADNRLKTALLWPLWVLFGFFGHIQ